MVKNNIFLTHPSTREILKGITRTVIKDIINNQKFILKEKAFTLRQLVNADEIFITSSGSLITPIVKVDNKIIGNGKIGILTKKIATLLYHHYKRQF